MTNEDDGQPAGDEEHTFSGRFGWECDCGRVVSIHDREYHRRQECSLESHDEAADD